MDLLPPSLRYIAGHINFGDYQIQDMNVDLGTSAVSIKIMGETTSFHHVEKEFLLHFSRVSKFDIVNALRRNPQSFLVSALEVEVHTVKQVKLGLFEFRFICHGPTEIVIQFTEFEYEIISGDGVQADLETAERKARVSELDSQELRDFAAQYAPSNALAHGRLGTIALNIGDYFLATKEFALSANDAPDHTPTRFLLAKSHFLLHQYQEALLLLSEILTENPNHPGAILYRIRVLGITEQWDDLQQSCDSQTLLVSGEIRLWHILALAETERKSEAEILYRSVSKSTRNRNPVLDQRIVSALPFVDAKPRSPGNRVAALGDSAFKQTTPAK